MVLLHNHIVLGIIYYILSILSDALALGRKKKEKVSAADLFWGVVTSRSSLGADKEQRCTAQKFISHQKYSKAKYNRSCSLTHIEVQSSYKSRNLMFTVKCNFGTNLCIFKAKKPRAKTCAWTERKPTKSLLDVKINSICDQKMGIWYIFHSSFYTSLFL